MDFTFTYNLSGTVANVVVQIEDAIISAAAVLGNDVTAVEAEIKSVLDTAVGKLAVPSFVQTVVTDVENVINEVKTDVSDAVADVVNFVDPATPAVTPTPAPVTPSTPTA